jgi:hypothetical protein
MKAVRADSRVLTLPATGPLPQGRQDGQPVVCVLSLSAIPDDRVCGQAEAFWRAGWKVIGLGLPGAKSSTPEWPIVNRPLPPQLERTTAGRDRSS